MKERRLVMAASLLLVLCLLLGGCGAQVVSGQGDEESPGSEAPVVEPPASPTPEPPSPSPEPTPETPNPVDLMQGHIAALTRGYDLSTPEKTAELYGRSQATRNGALELIVLAEELADPIREYCIGSGNYVIGVSSPWCSRYEVGSPHARDDGRVKIPLVTRWETSAGWTESELILIMENRVNEREDHWVIVEYGESTPLDSEEYPAPDES